MRNKGKRRREKEINFKVNIWNNIGNGDGVVGREFVFY